MKKIIFIILITIAVFLVLIYPNSFRYTIDYLKYYSWTDDQMPSLKKVTPDSKTIFTPVLDTKIIPDKNLIYCESFQHAWNKMCKEILHGKATVKGETNEYIDKLNKNIEKPNDLTLMNSEHQFVVDATVSGYEIKLCTSTNFEIKHQQKLQYIYEPLTFTLDSNEAQVKAFGFYKNSTPRSTRQLIYWYRDSKKSSIDQDYVIEIFSDVGANGEQSQIFLANIKPKNTLIESYMEAMDIIEKFKNKEFFDILGPRNQLIIPKIIFNFEFQLDFLSNIVFNDKYTISSNNKIILKFNGYGSNIIKHDDYYDCLTFEPSSFSYEFNKPFFLFIRKCENNKKHLPYFAAYIANEELLLKK